MTDDNPQRPASSPLDDHSLDGHTVAELRDRHVLKRVLHAGKVR